MNQLLRCYDTRLATTKIYRTEQRMYVTTNYTYCGNYTRVICKSIYSHVIVIYLLRIEHTDTETH